MGNPEARRDPDRDFIINASTKSQSRIPDFANVRESPDPEIRLGTRDLSHPNSIHSIPFHSIIQDLYVEAMYTIVHKIGRADPIG